MKNSERKQVLTQYGRYALMKKLREENRKKQAEEQIKKSIKKSQKRFKNRKKDDQRLQFKNRMYVQLSFVCT